MQIFDWMLDGRREGKEVKEYACISKRVFSLYWFRFPPLVNTPYCLCERLISWYCFVLVQYSVVNSCFAICLLLCYLSVPFLYVSVFVGLLCAGMCMCLRFLNLNVLRYLVLFCCVLLRVPWYDLESEWATLCGCAVSCVWYKTVCILWLFPFRFIFHSICFLG